jgi:hypothetical protein
MSIEDGKKINESFEKKQKEIDTLKLKADSVNYKVDSIKKDHRIAMAQSSYRLQKMYDDYTLEYNKNKSIIQERDTLKAMYMANKKIYEHREKEFRIERIHQQIFTFVIMCITMVLAVK